MVQICQITETRIPNGKLTVNLPQLLMAPEHGFEFNITVQTLIYLKRGGVREIYRSWGYCVRTML